MTETAKVLMKMSKTAVEEIKQSFRDFIAAIADSRSGRNTPYSMPEIVFRVLRAMILDCECRGNIESVGGTKIVPHTVMNLLRKAEGKRDFIRRMRKIAGWNDGFPLKILQHIQMRSL